MSCVRCVRCVRCVLMSQAEYHAPQWCERFGLMMEEYLLHAGQHTRELVIQNNLMHRLELVG